MTSSSGTNVFWQARSKADELINRIASKGLRAKISEEDKRQLFAMAWDLHRRETTNALGQLLLVDAALIQSVADASGKRPAWLAVADLGLAPTGELWFQPASEEVAYKYGLLLINSAIARCVSDDDMVLQTAEAVAGMALELFYAVPIGPSTWVAMTYTILAKCTQDRDPETSRGWAQYAVNMLQLCPMAEQVGLQVLASALAGVDAPSFMGTKKKRNRSNLPSFTAQDLYMFQDTPQYTVAETRANPEFQELHRMIQNDPQQANQGRTRGFLDMD